ncbi:MAG: DMT family transporter [Gammaproteobacteria bacterium]|nr:DMT family transporter [Gammaproteobacteria bacterium]
MKRELVLSVEHQGLIYGLLGVIGFSLTPPGTRMAVEYLDPGFVGLGRAVVAGLLASIILFVMKIPLPEKKYYKKFFIVSMCVGLIYPLLLGWSMQYITASHTGVVLGILPLATAVVGALRSGERPSAEFWLLSIFAALSVVAFSIINGGGVLQVEDLMLLVAVIIGAIGYTEGALLAKDLGGWQVICWAMVFALPVLIIPFVMIALPMELHVPSSAWYGFFYVAISSQLVSFFAWYKGLAMGGITRVSQLMFLMPFMTIIESQWLLNDIVGLHTYFFAALVIVIVLLSRRF